MHVGIKIHVEIFLIVVHIFFLCSGTLQFARSMNKDAIDIGCGMGRFFGILLAVYLLKFWSSTTVLFSFSFLPLILVAFNFYYGVRLSDGVNKSDGTKRGEGVLKVAWSKTGMNYFRLWQSIPRCFPLLRPPLSRPKFPPLFFPLPPLLQDRVVSIVFNLTRFQK